MKKSLLSSSACALLLFTQDGYCMDGQPNPQSLGDTTKQPRIETLQKPFNELPAPEETKAEETDTTLSTPAVNTVIPKSDTPNSPKTVPYSEKDETISPNTSHPSPPPSPSEIGAAIQLLENLKYALTSFRPKEIDASPEIPAPSSSTSLDSSTVPSPPKIDLMVSIPQPFTQFNPNLQRLISLSDEEKSLRNDVLSFIGLSDFWHNYLSCSLKITEKDQESATLKISSYSKKCDFNLKPTLKPCKEGMCFSNAFYEFFSNELSIFNIMPREEIFPMCLFIDKEEYFTAFENAYSKKASETLTIMAAMNANKLYHHLEFLYVLAQQIQDCKNLAQRILNPSIFLPHPNTSRKKSKPQLSMNQQEILLYNKMKNLEVFIDLIKHISEKTESDYLIIRPNRSQTEIQTVTDFRDRFIFAWPEFLETKCNERGLSLAELRVGPLLTDKKAIDTFGLFSEPLFLLLPSSLCSPDQIDRLFIRLHDLFYALEFERRLKKYISTNYSTLKSSLKPISEKHPEIIEIRENKLPELLFYKFQELTGRKPISPKTKESIRDLYKQLEISGSVVLKLSLHPTEEILQRAYLKAERAYLKAEAELPKQPSLSSSMTSKPDLPSTSAIPSQQKKKKSKKRPDQAKKTKQQGTTVSNATPIPPIPPKSSKDNEETSQQSTTVSRSSSPLSPPLISNSILEQLTTQSKDQAEPQNFEDIRRMLEQNEEDLSPESAESQHISPDPKAETNEEEKETPHEQEAPMSSLTLAATASTPPFSFPAPNTEIDIVDSMKEYLEKFLEINGTTANQEAVTWAQNSIHEIKKLRSDQEKLKAQQSTIQKLESQNKSKQVENDKLKQENQKQKQTISELQKSNKDLQTQLDKSKGEEKKLSRSNKQLKKTLEEEQRKTEDSTNLLVELRLAHSEIEQYKKDRKSYADQIASLRKQLSELQKQSAKDLTQQQKTAEREKDSIEHTSQKRLQLIQQQEKELEEMKEEIQNLEAKNKEQQQQLKELQATKVQNEQHSEKLRRLIKQSEQDIKRLEQELDDQKYQNLELNKQLEQIQIPAASTPPSKHSFNITASPFVPKHLQNKPTNSTITTPLLDQVSTPHFEPQTPPNFLQIPSQQHQSSSLISPPITAISSPESTPSPTSFLGTFSSNTQQTNQTLLYLPPLPPFSTSINSTFTLRQTTGEPTNISTHTPTSTPPNIMSGPNLFNSSFQLPSSGVIPVRTETDPSSIGTMSSSEDTSSVSSSSTQSTFSNSSFSTSKDSSLKQDSHHSRSTTLSSSMQSRSISPSPTHSSLKSTKTMHSVSPSFTPISRSGSRSSTTSSHQSVYSSSTTSSEGSRTSHSISSPSTSSGRSLSVPPSKSHTSADLATRDLRSFSVGTPLDGFSDQKVTPSSKNSEDAE